MYIIYLYTLSLTFFFLSFSCNARVLNSLYILKQLASGSVQPASQNSKTLHTRKWGRWVENPLKKNEWWCVPVLVGRAGWGLSIRVDWRVSCTVLRVTNGYTISINIYIYIYIYQIYRTYIVIYWYSFFYFLVNAVY